MKSSACWGGNTYREDTLDDKVVVLLERVLVALGEGGRELLRLVALRVLKGLAGEGEAAEEPHQALGRNALLLSLLVLDELFKRCRLGWSSIVSGFDFLQPDRVSCWAQSTKNRAAYSNVALEIGDNWSKSSGSKKI